jgi:hypothetical protein
MSDPTNFPLPACYLLSHSRVDYGLRGALTNPLRYAVIERVLEAGAHVALLVPVDPNDAEQNITRSMWSCQAQQAIRFIHPGGIDQLLTDPAVHAYVLSGRRITVVFAGLDD